MRTLRLTVAIPTYHRPELLRLGLEAVLQQTRAMSDDGDSAVTADVLVIDNDVAGSARAVVAELENVRYVVEPTPGIVAARNRALDETHDSDLLVFIDDDERPQPAWLEALVSTYRASHPTAVMGRVVTVYDADNVDPRIAVAERFARPRMPTGTPLSVAAAGNLLLDLTQVRALRARFDSRLGLSGGEDTLFSRTLVRSGGRIVFCDESVAEDHIVAARLTRDWMYQRALSQGNVAVAVEILLAENGSQRLSARVHGLLRGGIRVIGGAARAGFGLAASSDRHQALGTRTFLRGVGMLLRSAGRPVEEYART